MDNKKWYKKFATIVWWTISILPLLVSIIHFTGYHLTFNSGIQTANEMIDLQENVAGDFLTILNNNLTNFSNISMGSLNSTFTNLFTLLGITDTTIAILFGYMLSVQLYHLIFDCLVFFIHLLHEYTNVERWTHL